MGHQARCDNTRVRPVDPGDIALSELVRGAAVGSQRNGDFVKVDLGNQALVGGRGESFLQGLKRHAIPRPIVRIDGRHFARQEALVVLVDIQPTAEEIIRLYPWDGRQVLHVRTIGLLVHALAVVGQVYSRRGEAGNRSVFAILYTELWNLVSVWNTVGEGFVGCIRVEGARRGLCIEKTEEYTHGLCDAWVLASQPNAGNGEVKDMLAVVVGG